MAEVTSGLRGTDSYPGNQRPTNFKGDIKTAGKTRVSHADVAAMLKSKRKPKRSKR